MKIWGQLHSVQDRNKSAENESLNKETDEVTAKQRSPMRYLSKMEGIDKIVHLTKIDREE